MIQKSDEATAKQEVLPQDVIVELIEGAEAHPETSDLFYMPPLSENRKVVRNAELGTNVMIDTNVEVNPNDLGKKYWLIGYLYQGPDVIVGSEAQPSAGNAQFETMHELARCFMFSQEEDPNGFYALQINNLLIEKANEGNMANEIRDFLAQKVAEARNNINSGLWIKLDE